MRATNQRTNWRVVNILNGADIVLYEETPGLYSGLITMRTPSPFNLILGALRSLILTLDDTPELVSDTVPEALSEDFFLWLVDRDEASGDTPIADGYSLLSIVEISSKDRQFRSARFKDTANAERIELAALIARGRVGFGPAKVTLSSDIHEATFEVEFHLDGGFQPLRSSEYDEENFSAEALGSALVDDIWTDVLPSLRKSYDDDEGWQDSRRAALRESAVDTICEQLNLVRR